MHACVYYSGGRLRQEDCLSPSIQVSLSITQKLKETLGKSDPLQQWPRRACSHVCPWTALVYVSKGCVTKPFVHRLGGDAVCRVVKDSRRYQRAGGHVVTGSRPQTGSEAGHQRLRTASSDVLPPLRRHFGWVSQPSKQGTASLLLSSYHTAH